jgi:hypothetical protein
MIRLKKILLEISDSDFSRMREKIQNKEFRFVGQGDNGRVYEIDGEDKVFKLTTDAQEYEVAEVIVGRESEFSTFIAVHYVGKLGSEQMFIMSKASELSGNDKNAIDLFMQGFKTYAYEQGGEVSIFDYLDADGARDADTELVNFLRALQTDIAKTGIEDLELDLDFKTDNVMRWQGRLVLVDW